MKSFKNHYEIDLLETTVSELLDEVSSIEVESQNYITTTEENKMHQNNKEESATANFINPAIKNKIERVTDTYTQQRKNHKLRTITISK